MIIRIIHNINCIIYIIMLNISIMFIIKFIIINNEIIIIIIIMMIIL